MQPEISRKIQKETKGYPITDTSLIFSIYYDLRVINVLPAAEKMFMPARDTGFNSR